MKPLPDPEQGCVKRELGLAGRESLEVLLEAGVQIDTDGHTYDRGTAPASMGRILWGLLRRLRIVMTRRCNGYGSLGCNGYSACNGCS